MKNTNINLTNELTNQLADQLAKTKSLTNLQDYAYDTLSIAADKLVQKFMTVNFGASWADYDITANGLQYKNQLAVNFYDTVAARLLNDYNDQISNLLNFN